MNYHIVNNWQHVPDLASIVRKAFVGYKRRKVLLHSATTVCLMDLNWSGGTRSEYASVNLATGTVQTIGDSITHPDHNTWEGRSVPIPQGFAIVRGGHFCGKASTLSIYLRPEDFAKFAAYAQAVSI